MNGYDTTRRIRELDKSIPIVAQTALAFDDDVEKSLEAGCNTHISKPTDLKLLVKVITDYLLSPGGEF